MQLLLNYTLSYNTEELDAWTEDTEAFYTFQQGEQILLNFFFHFLSLLCTISHTILHLLSNCLANNIIYNFFRHTLCDSLSPHDFVSPHNFLLSLTHTHTHTHSLSLSIPHQLPVSLTQYALPQKVSISAY